MFEQLLRDFAKENFGNGKYFPVAHGKAEVIKTFGLMVKEKRSPLKRPFKPSNYLGCGGLENYLQEEKKDEFLDAVNSHIKKEKNKCELKADGEDDGGTVRNFEVGVEAADVVGATIKINENLGELDLGKIDEEYIMGPDMNAILAKTVLDGDQMESIRDKSLYLIHTVIYSERFELKGNRRQEIEVDAKVKIPNQLLAKLKGYVKKMKIPPKMATRTTRGPILLQCCRVKYIPETKHLTVAETVGKGLRSRGVGDDDEEEEEYENTVVCLEEGDSDFAEYLIDEDDKKLEKIMESVLMPTKNREERKARVTKYLKWFEVALNKDQKITTNEPLSEADREFLHCIFVPAHLNTTTVDLSSFDKEKIQGYAIVLKVIHDMSDEEWNEVEQVWYDEK